MNIWFNRFGLAALTLLVLCCLANADLQAQAQEYQLKAVDNATPGLNPTGVLTSVAEWQLHFCCSEQDVEHIGSGCESMREVDVIPVAGNPICLAISPDGRTLYCGSSETNSLTVLDLARKVLVTTTPIGNAPSAMALSRDGTKLYIGIDQALIVLAVDTATNQVSARIDLKPRKDGASDDGVKGLAVSPDGGTLFACGCFDGVQVIDTKNGNLITEIPLIDQQASQVVQRFVDNVNTIQAPMIAKYHVKGVNKLQYSGTQSWASSFALSNDGNFIVASDATSDLQISDSRRGNVISRIRTRSGPSGISNRLAFSPDSRMVYFINGLHETPAISMIDLNRGGIVNTIKIPDWANYLALSPDGQNLYAVTNTTLVRINTLLGGINGTTDFTQPFAAQTPR